MFDTFGDFGSVEEMNLAAEGLRAEGDIENLKVLAKENGIDISVAEMYAVGQCEMFADYFTAAVGKLQVELAEYKNKNMPAEEIVDYLINECMDEIFANRVRNNGKHLKDCLNETEKLCKEECKRKGKFHIPDMVVFTWAKNYYLM